MPTDPKQYLEIVLEWKIKGVTITGRMGNNGNESPKPQLSNLEHQLAELLKTEAASPLRSALLEFDVYYTKAELHELVAKHANANESRLYMTYLADKFAVLEFFWEMWSQWPLTKRPLTENAAALKLAQQHASTLTPMSRMQIITRPKNGKTTSINFKAPFKPENYTIDPPKKLKDVINGES